MARPARDVPGPHPENQRKRSELRGPRQALIGVLAIAGVLAVLAGVSTSSPLLGVVLGGTQALGAWLLLGGHRHGRDVALASALIAICWGIAQILVLDGVTWFSLTLLGVGGLEALLVAACAPRNAGRQKKMRRP